MPSGRKGTGKQKGANENALIHATYTHIRGIRWGYIKGNIEEKKGIDFSFWFAAAGTNHS
jgi:hypothetical protein